MEYAVSRLAMRSLVFLVAALLDVPRIIDGDYLRIEGVAVGRAHGATAVPYEGARPMRLVDSEDGEALSRLVEAVCADLRNGSVRKARR